MRTSTGRASLGAIQSVDVTWHMVGTATGPLIAAFLREYYGSFPPVYLTLMLLPLLSARWRSSCDRRRDGGGIDGGVRNAHVHLFMRLLLHHGKMRRLLLC